MILTTSRGSIIQVAAGDNLSVGGNAGRISSISVAEFADIQEMRSMGAPSQFVNGMTNANIELEIMFFEISTGIQEAFTPYCTAFTVDRQEEAVGHFGIDSVNHNFDPILQGSTTTVHVTGFAERMADFLHATSDTGNGQTYVNKEAVQQISKASKKTKKATKIHRNQSRWEALEL